jgi:twitching motility protein PilI
MNDPLQSPHDDDASAAKRTPAADLWRGLGFRVGERNFVASLTEVNEILAVPAFTRVPGARAWLLGVASVRGNLIALVDLKNFLFGAAANLADCSRVLLVRQSGGSVGLLVDEVVGQRHFSAEQRIAAPAQTDAAGHYVVERFMLDAVRWERFSIAALVRANEFAQAAA